MLAHIAMMMMVLSLLAIGGANSIVPELHRQVVDVMGAMTDAEFTNLFAIAQTAPGPNVLILSLVGWRLAGAAGLAVATLATVIPTSLLALATGRFLSRSRESRWLKAIKAGLVPLAIGLILASGLVIARAADRDLATLLMSVATAVAVALTRINPIWLMAGAAAAALALRAVSP
ncbi:MAG: chromate transporter [Beijerinckiaceae bacterium]